MENQPSFAGGASGESLSPHQARHQAGVDRIRVLLASASSPGIAGPYQRTLLLSVLEEIDRFIRAYPGERCDELGAMRQIATGALVID